MSSSTAELTLILKAQNLAKAAIGDLKTAVANVGDQATIAGNRLSAAFAGKGQQLARELGDLTVRILNGQNWTEAGLAAGATLAGGLVTAFGEKIVEKIAGSALFATITGALTTAGTTIGGIISAAIPVGMALAPYLIGAAIIAAIAFVVTHPEIAGEALRIGGKIVGGILSGLVGLAGKILGLVVAAPGAIASVIGGFAQGIADWLLGIPAKLVGLGLAIVTTIVGGMVSLPGEVARVIREAFANLHINIGPFHISAAGVTIDLPNLSADPRVMAARTGERHGLGGHAAGGWVGLHGPELSWLGERGPEFVVPNDQLGRRGAAGGRPVEIPVILDGREVGRVVDERLYYALSTAVPTPKRV